MDLWCVIVHTSLKLAKKAKNFTHAIDSVDLLTNFAIKGFSDMGNIVNLKQLTSLARFSTEFSNFSDDYLFTRITSDSISKALRYDSMNKIEYIDGPRRLDGMSWILCFRGRMELEINLKPITLTANCIAVTTPGSMIEMKDLERDGLDCYMLFVSTEFMKDINFDLNVLGSATRLGNDSLMGNMMQITEEEADTLRDYFKLLRRNSATENGSIYTKSIVRCVIAALTYQVLQMVTRRIKDNSESKMPRSRRTTYVNEFMRLVHEHHTRERSVAFYAGKLFISPKYLSLIIKESTGKSATDVIDSYVVLEAKNLLRFSGKNIQQVAYELNFPNQSSFGKYFKHLTGMSPSEYQRS